MGETHHTVARWRERMTFDAETTTNHRLVLDMLDDHGPTPIELLLTALAGCAGMSVLSILHGKREPVEGLEVRVEGHRAEQPPRVYTDIVVVYRVVGDVKPASVERAIALSHEKYCGVSVMLGATTKMTQRYEIVRSRVA